MGTPYANQTASGYSASPPPDDGSATAANKVTYAKIKGQLGDPLKGYIDAVNSALRTALNVTPTTQSTAYTTTTADHLRPIEVTGTTTISLGDAATMVASSMGYQAIIVNTGTALVTVGVITATDKIAGHTNGTITLAPGQGMVFTVNSTSNGYDITASTGFAPFVLTGAAGTNTATANAPANLTALFAGLQILWTPAVTNTGATTLAITPSGGTALAATNVFVHGAACTGGELKASVPLKLEYDGTQFNVLGGGLDGFANQSANTILAGPTTGAAAAPTFRALVAADGTGALSGTTLLASKTASASASLIFTSADFDWTLYDEYEFHFVQLVPATASVLLQAQISEDAGVTYKSGAATYASYLADIYNAAVAADAGTSTLFNLIGGGSTNTQDNGTDYGLSGKVTIFKPNSAVRKSMKSDLSFHNSNGIVTFVGGHLYSGDTGAWNGIKFFYNSGNIASGTIYAYGIRKA